MKSRLLLCAVAAVSLSALGSSPLAVAPDKAFSIDTSGGICVVTNLSGVPLPYRIAETVTASSSDRVTVETLVPVASAAGNYSWTPSAGGAWTLTNSFEGVATFVVRYSLFGAQGAGTESDPAKIVDGWELADLIDAGTATDGFTFVLYGPVNMAAVELPSGWALQGLAGGKSRLISASSGMYCLSAQLPFAVETESEGPNRTVEGLDKVWKVAYSGDNWTRTGSESSTLTFLAPSGATTTDALSGTGIHPFRATEKGRWTVTLATASKTLSGIIRVKGGGIVFSIR